MNLGDRFVQRRLKLRKGKCERCALGELGQATLEYILIIIIILILTLSLLYQFHDSFRIYAQAFFDGYIRCLLEVGELPGTGSTCAQEFTAFNAKAGKALLKDNLPEPGNGGGGKANQAPPPAKKPVTAARETKSGGGSSGGSTPIGRFGSGDSQASTPIGKLTGNDSGGQRESLIGASNTIPVGRLQTSGPISSTFYTSEDEVEGGQQEKPKETVATGKKVAGGTENLRPVKFAERQPAQAKPKDDSDSSFTIGALIRFLFIILIIVALVLFFGGQLMQIAKSREKGGG